MKKKTIVALWSAQFILMISAVIAFWIWSRAAGIGLMIASYLPMMLGGQSVGISKSEQETANASVPKFAHYLFNVSAAAFVATIFIGHNIQPTYTSLAATAFLVACAFRDCFLVRHYFSNSAKPAFHTPAP